MNRGKGDKAARDGGGGIVGSIERTTGIQVMKVCSLPQKIRGKLAAAERMNLGACGDQSAGDEQRSLHVTAGRDANERDTSHLFQGRMFFEPGNRLFSGHWSNQEYRFLAVIW